MPLFPKALVAYLSIMTPVAASDYCFDASHEADAQQLMSQVDVQTYMDNNQLSIAKFGVEPCLDPEFGRQVTAAWLRRELPSGSALDKILQRGGEQEPWRLLLALHAHLRALINARQGAEYERQQIAAQRKKRKSP